MINLISEFKKMNFCETEVFFLGQSVLIFILFALPFKSIQNKPDYINIYRSIK